MHFGSLVPNMGELFELELLGGVLVVPSCLLFNLLGVARVLAAGVGGVLLVLGGELTLRHLLCDVGA